MRSVRRENREAAARLDSWRWEAPVEFPARMRPSTPQLALVQPLPETRAPRCRWCGIRSRGALACAAHDDLDELLADTIRPLPLS